MLDDCLDVLLAITDGDDDLDAIQASTGLSRDETADALRRLLHGGLLRTQETGLLDVSTSGRLVAHFAAAERTKRLLAESLGAVPGSAC